MTTGNTKLDLSFLSPELAASVNQHIRSELVKFASVKEKESLIKFSKTVELEEDDLNSLIETINGADLEYVEKESLIEMFNAMTPEDKVTFKLILDASSINLRLVKNDLWTVFEKARKEEAEKTTPKKTTNKKTTASSIPLPSLPAFTLDGELNGFSAAFYFLGIAGGAIYLAFKGLYDACKLASLGIKTAYKQASTFFKYCVSKWSLLQDRVKFGFHSYPLDSRVYCPTNAQKYRLSSQGEDALRKLASETDLECDALKQAVAKIFKFLYSLEKLTQDEDLLKDINACISSLQRGEITFKERENKDGSKIKLLDVTIREMVATEIKVEQCKPQDKSQSTKTQSTKTQSTKTQSTKTQSTKTQSTKTQSTKTQSTKTQSTKTQSTKTQSTKTTLCTMYNSLKTRRTRKGREETPSKAAANAVWAPEDKSVRVSNGGSRLQIM